eukprot:superscaffoldBa00000222_g2868
MGCALHSQSISDANTHSSKTSVWHLHDSAQWQTGDRPWLVYRNSPDSTSATANRPLLTSSNTLERDEWDETCQSVLAAGPSCTAARRLK